MPNSPLKSPLTTLAALLRDLLFFGLFFIYLWRIVDLRFIYHHSSGTIINFPPFFRTWPFFREFLSHPGGIIQYLSALLAQPFYISWAGALVVTAQAWLLSLFTGRILAKTASPRIRILRFIPPILLLCLYSQYTFYFTTTLALTAALGFASLYLLFTKAKALTRLLVYTILTLLLVIIAGSASIVFAAVCITYELFFARNWLLAILYTLLALALPYIVTIHIYNVSLAQTIADVLPVYLKTLYSQPNTRGIRLVYAMYLFLPPVLLLSGLYNLVRSKRPPKPAPAEAEEQPAETETPKPKPAPAWVTNLRTWVIDTVVLLIVAGAAVSMAADSNARLLFAVDYLAASQMWPRLLGLTTRYRTDNPIITYNANRAMANTGRLPYDLLEYPQNRDSLFLQSIAKVFDWKKYDVYFDLGQMNLAEHGAGEALARFGRRPAILKQLAIINLVKQKNAVAEVYLRALTKTFFYDKWAHRQLQQLEVDPNLAGDPEIQRLRSLMIDPASNAYFGIQSDPEQNLLALLDKNKTNKMAFEYLMAFYLTNGRLEKFMQNLYRLDNFDYPALPRTYEEAVILYQSTKQPNFQLKGRAISPETTSRFNGFAQIFGVKYAQNKALAENELAAQYGDTYFFYFIYGYSRP